MKKYTYKLFNRILITIILTLVLLIGFKSNITFKNEFYTKVFDSSFSFAKVNKWYQSHFKETLPFPNFLADKTTSVFNETLSYSSKKDFKDGVKLKVSDNYLVPVIEEGMVTFIGKKKDIGNTIIIEQPNGIELWYGNVNNLKVSLYDYVTKGTLLGEVNGTNLYLIYKKDGQVLDYKKYF